MADFERIHLLISGRVHGVGFRYSTQKQAASLNLSGWVKNLPGSQVEVWAEGPTAQIDQLLLWCHKGPQFASVQSVLVVQRQAISHSPISPFKILR